MEGVLEAEESFSEQKTIVDWHSIQFSFLQSLSRGLHSMRATDVLCDVTVVVDDESFRAHKAILVAISDVFRAMFTSGLKESSSDQITLQDDVDLSAEGFSLLLDFAYTGQMELNAESVFEVLATACHLHVQPAIDACISYIDHCFHNELLDFDDFLKISSMAGNYGLERLKDIADEHIARNFAEVSQTEDFVEHMTSRSMVEFLQRDDLAVSSEEQVLKAISTWLTHDKANRIHHTMPLLRKTRLGLVSPQALVSHIDSDLQSIPQCKTIFDQFMQHHAVRSGSTTGPGPLMTSYPEMFTPRVSTKAIIAIGGQTTFESIRYYSQDKHCWVPLKKFAQLPFSCVSHHSALTVSGQLFVAGGEYTQNNKVVTHNFFFQYDTSTNRWLRLPTMKVARSRFAMVYMDGFIYAIGGQNQNKKWICAVERFDMNLSKWTMVKPLDTALKQPAVVPFNGKLLAVGLDFNSALHVLLFHPKQNCWTRHANTYYPQCSIGLPVVHGDTCYQVAFRSTQSKLDPTSEWAYYPEVLPYTCDFDANTSPQDSQLALSDADGHIAAQDQSFISESNLPTFRVEDKVYVAVNGHIQSTGVKVDENQVYDVDVDLWDRLGHIIEGAAITCFTFDRYSLE